MIDAFLHMDIVHLVSLIGYIGVIAIIFAETGLFFGFFLPGDSLIFASGLLASKGIFNIWILVPAVIVTAIVGYFVGYWFGDRLGDWLLHRKESFWFKRSYLEKARKFYHRHGGKSLILGRLVPIVRTFVPIVAGMVEMPIRKYSFYNITGALIWGGGVGFIGYYIGGIFPEIVNYLFLLVVLVVLVSILPAVVHFIKERGRSKNKPVSKMQ